MEHNPQSASVIEQRVAVRQKSFTKAQVNFNRGQCSYEALARNVSATGVKLCFGERIELPDSFNIKIGTAGQTHKAHVAWQSGFEIGVAFTG